MAQRNTGLYEMMNLAEAKQLNYTMPMYAVANYAMPTYNTQTVPITPSKPAEPVSTPTYEKATGNFGTIRHIEPVRDHFINARLNLEALRDFAVKPSGTEKSLLERVEAYLKKQLGADYEKLLGELGVSLAAGTGSTPSEKISSRFFARKLPKLGDSGTINSDKISSDEKPWATVEPIAFTHNAHSALFGAGTVMSSDIRTMEALRLALVKVRRNQQQNLNNKQAELSELKDRIVSERSTLNGLEAKRRETLDDYSVAQRLLNEHWHEIEAKYAERQRIIDSNLGLYYVRVRETPLSRTLPDPLALRAGNANDLVPGCPQRSTPLSEELHVFFNTILDIPAADWMSLSKLAHFLPSRMLLEQMVQQRRQRITLKQASSIGHPTLNSLLLNHQNIIQSIAARPFMVGALREMQQQGHKILALEDLLNSPIPALREPAHQLQQNLISAAGCLLDKLRNLKPSIRLAWADLTDDNRLAVETPERWPQLSQAEADDFNNLRTLMELVNWWFRQLDSDASGASRTAMRNFIRACILLAAGDDPQQLLHGQLKTLPSRFRPGELLRLDLNREPAAGNMLHLLDEQQQVIAIVRVEDHDDKGTVASISSVLKADVNLALAMRVTGMR